jgi:hypothetical protein
MSSLKKKVLNSTESSLVQHAILMYMQIGSQKFDTSSNNRPFIPLNGKIQTAFKEAADDILVGNKHVPLILVREAGSYESIARFYNRISELKSTEILILDKLRDLYSSPMR